MKGRAPLREERGRQMTLLYCFETAFHETLRVQVRRHIVTGESFWSPVQISKEKEHTIAFDKISFLSLGFRKNRGFFSAKILIKLFGGTHQCYRSNSAFGLPVVSRALNHGLRVHVHQS